jgi:tetratricopeptide (TPR) repeat protein
MPELDNAKGAGRETGSLPTMQMNDSANLSDVGASILAQATEAHLANDWPKAEELYCRLLEQNHDSASLLAAMGTMYLQSQRYGLAISLLHRAADKTPQSDIFCNLAIAYKYTGQYDKAHQNFRRACDHKPTAQSFANYSALFTSNGTPEKGIEIAEKALKMDKQNAMAHWNKSMCHLEAGEWAEGWDENEWGFDAHMRIRRKIDNEPYWDGTEGKTVVVYGEQGLGDEILFASMLPDMMAKNNVILESHPRLQTLFQKAFPGLTVYGTRDKNEITWHNNHKIDYSVSIGSLGKWFRRSKESFPGTPYLKADPLPKGEKFRVGISWTGGMKQGRIKARSIPLAWWRSILDVPNVEFVSLQYTDCEAELSAAKQYGYDIKVMDEYVKAEDYYETARLVASCDLVITIATSVYHLAGALGVPCWVMVHNKPMWREQFKGPIPWYRSVRAYRQPAGDADAWRPVIERVGFDLSELVGGEQKLRRTA